MIATRFETPEASLAGYYRNRGEPVPAEQALAWLRSFVLRRFSVDSEFILAERLFGFASGAAFAGANTARVRYQWRRYYFPMFVNRLCLSRELVAVRMVQRGTFDQSTFEYHKTYPLPNRWREPAPLTFEKAVTQAFEQLVGSSSRPHRRR